MDKIASRVSLRDLFRVFFVIGATSFGGGLAAWIHRETVTRRRWLNNDQFLSGLALSQVLPGANVTNLAIYIGHALRGWVGALTAVTAVLAAPFFLCIAFAAIYGELSHIPGFHAAMEGVAATAVGMILRMGTIGALHSCRAIAPAAVAVAVFVAIGFLRWPLAPVVLVAAPISVALAWPRGDAHA